MPNTIAALASWDTSTGELPDDAVFEAAYFDLFIAAEAKRHTRLGSRLNYETTGMSSLYRQTGRKLDDLGKDIQKPLEKLNPAWKDGETWYSIFNAGTDTSQVDAGLLAAQRERIARLTSNSATGPVNFAPRSEMTTLLPRTCLLYTSPSPRD